MNQVILIGRLTKDPELKYIPGSQTAVAKFSLAVERPFQKDKEKQADFFNIVVFGKPAENCEKYVAKGRLVAISGRIQNNNYTTQSGEKRYTTEIIAERVEFLEWGDKTSGNRSDQGQKSFDQSQDSFNQPTNLPEGFQALDEDDDDDIPF